MIQKAISHHVSNSDNEFCKTQNDTGCSTIEFKESVCNSSESGEVLKVNELQTIGLSEEVEVDKEFTIGSSPYKVILANQFLYHCMNWLNPGEVSAIVSNGLVQEHTVRKGTERTCGCCSCSSFFVATVKFKAQSVQINNTCIIGCSEFGKESENGKYSEFHCVKCYVYLIANYED
ncbi:hypothetical protein MACJ_003828 [Theileria orientalis]|uniref:Uncharacterized protein n=1 Tax=Theileria orientalis TaxID=68886 RepID=A0A976XKE2_THEOR|nr:hypothetical protein MACJ_003828 [Theileria orientalis]